MILIRMNGVSGSSAAANSIAAATTSTQQRVSVGMLKKALEGQKSQAAELVQMIEGKGQIIDIRA